MKTLSLKDAASINPSLWVSKTPQVMIVEVTPGLARDILENHNLSNPRRIRSTRVDAISASLQMDRFGFTGQGVTVGTDGQLVDGQHRLQAIIQSGVAKTIIFAFGCDTETRYDIDTVVTPRHHADNLSVYLGITRPKAEVAASGIKVILDLVFDVTRKFSQAELDLLADAYKTAGVLTFLEKNFAKGRKRSNIQPIYGALAAAYPLAPEKVRAFTTQLFAVLNREAGATIPSEGSPVLALANYLEGAYVFRRDPSSKRAEKTLKAVQKFIAGETMTKALPDPVFKPEFLQELQAVHRQVIGTELLATLLTKDARDQLAA